SSREMTILVGRPWGQLFGLSVESRDFNSSATLMPSGISFPLIELWHARRAAIDFLINSTGPDSPTGTAGPEMFFEELFPGISRRAAATSLTREARSASLSTSGILL